MKINNLVGKKVIFLDPDDKEFLLRVVKDVIEYYDVDRETLRDMEEYKESISYMDLILRTKELLKRLN